VAVLVGVDVCVTVALTVGICVAVAVWVSGVRTTVVLVGKITAGVCVAVGSGGAGGVERKLEINTNKRRMPIMIGKAYFRSSIGKLKDGTTGISPEYPNVVSKLLRLAA
jgi:hypothetical protein